MSLIQWVKGLMATLLMRLMKDAPANTVLQVEDGDILIMTWPPNVRRGEIEEMANGIASYLPPTCAIVAIRPDIKFMVIRPKSGPEPTMQGEKDG